MGALFAAAFVAAVVAARADADVVRFGSREEAGGIVVTGENAHPAMPFHVLVSFPTLENLRPSVALPARIMLPPRAKLDLLTLTRMNPQAASRMNASYRFSKGDPAAIHDNGVRYLFPYEHGTKRQIGQGYYGAFTHKDKCALDFQMPEGTPVCAAREGIVVETKDDSTRGGPGPEFAALANFVDVLHTDGTWAEYAHLKPGGVAVRVGDRVAAGQVLGYSGNTGQTNGPHLHFAVFKAAWEFESGLTVPTAFAHLDGAAITPGEGSWYYAVHPGGAPFAPVLASRLTDEELDRRVSPAPQTGTVTFRPENVDGVTYFWCANGTREPRAVTLEFSQLINLKPSRRVPLTRNVPPGREAYFLSLSPTVRTGKTGYRLRYRHQPLK